VAVYKEKCRGYEIKINDVDHRPPHCHVNIDGRDTKISLFTLKILNPPPHELPPTLRKCLRESLEDLLEAWEKVHILPPGGV